MTATISKLTCDGFVIHPETGRELTYEFTVDGWIYATDQTFDDGERKLSHHLICDEAIVDIDWLPWLKMSAAGVHSWLVLGCPRRQGLRPLDSSDLLHLAIQRISRAENAADADLRAYQKMAAADADLYAALEMVDEMFSSPGKINKATVMQAVRAALAKSRAD